MNESFSVTHDGSTTIGGTLNNYNNLDSNTASQLSSSSTSSLSSSNSQSGLISNLRRIFNASLMQYLVNLKVSDTHMKGWRYYVLFGWLHLHYMFIGWIINFSSTYYSNDYTASTLSSRIVAPFGFYGGWVARVLNFPLTLSIDAMGSPYELFIALIALFIVLIMLLPFLMVLKTRSFFAEKKEKLDFYMIIYSFVMLLMAPFMMFVMSSFIDCNLNDYTLMRFPSKTCYGANNIVLIVISLVGMIVLCCFSAIYTFILPINDLKTSLPFQCEDSLSTMVTFSVTLFRILFMFVIPPQYLYIRSIVHMILSLVVAVVQIYTLSYFRRFENTIHFASTLCSVGASIGVLVSSLVNSKMEDMMGIAMFFGIVLGLSLIFSIIGVLIGDIYTRSIMRRIRSIMKSPSAVVGHMASRNSYSRQDSYSTEKESAEIYLSLENSLRQLKLFLRFCSSAQDIELVVSFIKGISTKKQFNDPKLITTSAIMIGHRWNDTNRYNFSLYLLKKASRLGGNYWETLNMHYRVKQFECF
ncbi:predicted protein [Naegleria gruberi]|uniref:Predicted protein n=1 Tax=Naegleria gruberi TaxID=5762 RepID=D2W565_NAEGR|nr:uncharacterized protein NAEGRDRAFT_76554 [Naegleria gruberi]EFC35787.1 predicted protein [Naegleria gruberi]|eukprot:XP_002668531.1 predicted protein [Naegleria gruberi strain NEG-M]